MKKIAIMSVPNGVGISRDVNLMVPILRAAGYEVDTYHMYRMGAAIEQRKQHYDLVIYLERIAQRTLEIGKKLAFIPNQEWCEPEWLPLIESFDCVFTKTRFAEKVFTDLGIKTEFISFTSEDRYLPDIKKDDFHWLHVAGKSIQKQTNTVIQTWVKNPGFPNLTIVQDPSFFQPRPTVKNISFINDHYPDNVLQTMQNAFAVHVCPSETEGFGHYIMEALSTKSLVITTNAPPMSELVSPNYGVLVSHVASRPMRLSTSYIISTETLEKAVVKAMILSDKRPEMGAKARAFFLDNDLFFKKRLVEAVNALLL